MKSCKDIFAANFKRLRTQKNLTQEQMAEKLDVGNKSTISSWETAQRLPEAAMLDQIAEVLGVSVAALFTGDHAQEAVQCPKTMEEFLNALALVCGTEKFLLGAETKIEYKEQAVPAFSYDDPQWETIREVAACRMELKFNLSEDALEDIGSPEDAANTIQKIERLASLRRDQTLDESMYLDAVHGLIRRATADLPF